MRGGPFSPGVFWVKLNIALFSAYAFFGFAAFLWPSAIEGVWLALLHIATLVVELAIVYGLVRRIPRTNYLVALVSFIMLLHLLVFIFIPLSMSIAYIGPSRSFYSLLAVIVSKALSEEHVDVSITAFNVLMALVHGINLCFFSRRKTAVMFSPPSKGG